MVRVTPNLHDPGALWTSTLGLTPLAEWLAESFAERLTGTLVLEEPDGVTHAVQMTAGVRLKVWLGSAGPNDGAARLVDTLVRLCDCPPSTAVAAFAGTGDATREQDAGEWVNPLELIWRVVRRQVRTDDVDATAAELRGCKLSIAADAAIDEFRFAGVEHTVVDVLRACPLSLTDLLASGLGAPPQLLRLLHALKLAGCLVIEPARAVEPATLAGAPLELPSRTESGIPGPLDATESAAPPVAERPEFLDPSAPSEQAASDQTAPSVPPAPAGSAAAKPGPSSAPPRSTERPATRTKPPASSIPPASFELVELQEELRQRVERPPRDHYEVLGVPRDASAAAIRAAAGALLERYNPGRLAHLPHELRRVAAFVFAQGSEALRVLGDPFGRAAYQRALRDGSAAPPDSSRLALAYRAMMGTRRIEALVARGDFESAEREVIRAIGDDSTQHELVALHFWIRAQRASEDLPQLLGRYDRMLGAAPETVKLHWYRGQILKKMGKHASALQEFRSALELEPRFTDAAREVRHYELTREHWLGPPAKKGSGTFARSGAGLLRRLFKKSS